MHLTTSCYGTHNMSCNQCSTLIKCTCNICCEVYLSFTSSINRLCKLFFFETYTIPCFLVEYILADVIETPPPSLLLVFLHSFYSFSSLLIHDGFKPVTGQVWLTLWNWLDGFITIYQSLYSLALQLTCCCNGWSHSCTIFSFFSSVGRCKSLTSNFLLVVLSSHY